MDGRTTYSKLLKMLDNYRGKILTIHELRRLIMINVGSEERTILSCMRIMSETGLIKDINNSRFEVISKQA